MKRIVLLCFLFSNVAFSQNLNFGLQAYYPFTGNANDQSGNNNNPIFNNATLSPDRFGTANSAYRFNGFDTYMQVPNSSSLQLGNLMSLCAWVKPLGYYTGTCYNNMLLMKGGEYTNNNYYLRFADVATGCTAPNINDEHFHGGTTYGTVIGPSPLVQLNQWYSVVWTYDGANVRLYVNCNLITTKPAGGLSFINFDDLYMGRMNDPANPGYPYWLNGDLDEVRIYNRALTQNEVNLYGDCALAPVKLTSFNASVVDNKQIKLSWNTEEESGIKNYTVERSVSGNGGYSAIGTVASKNNSTPVTYSLTDNTFKANVVYYYRLAINENDGSKKYSEIKTAKVNRNEFYSFVYPNPTTGVVNLFLKNNSELTDITVYNTSGQLILKTISYPRQSGVVLLDLTDSPSGSYWINITNGTNKSVQKIFKP